MLKFDNEAQYCHYLICQDGIGRPVDSEKIIKRGKKMTKKVMIVDDDPYILIAVRKVLESVGFEVFAVNSGVDCIEEMKNGFKGVILVDVMMPFMDGWDTIEQIVKGGFIKDNIVAIITAKNIPDIKRQDMEQYVVDYISKPFKPDELISSVKEYFTHLN